MAVDRNASSSLKQHPLRRVQHTGLLHLSAGSRTPLSCVNLFYAFLWLLAQMQAMYAAEAPGLRDSPRHGQCSAMSINRLQQDSPETTGRPVPNVTNEQQAPPRQYGYRVVRRYPHDPNAFTEGLVFLGDRLFESTGLRGESSLREVDLTSGQVLKIVELDDGLFGEGLTVWNKRLVQLTWQSGRALIYETADLERIDQFSFTGPGWGATTVGNELVISNGTAILVWLDPGKVPISRALYVREGEQLVQGLNELEYMEGKILANVWPSNCIAEINLATGQVTGWIDMNGLYPEKDRLYPTAVLNGIAYNSERERLFVTGKYWPYMYEIELLPVKPGKHTAAGKQ